ncbi:MAG: alanine racemase [Opitutaceae bacterium]|nr:alanine racemase [Opitutaceae bacterium]
MHTLPSPSILVDRPRLLANLRRLQSQCDQHGVELRPHIKTHKMVAVAREQLAAGARGLTCAKIGEAEAMLPSGVRSLFIAHSLVDLRQAPRLAALAEQLDDLRVGVTSELHCEALERLAGAVGRRLSVMLAVDTGLGREGVRDDAAAQRLAARLAKSPRLELRGFYSHEGFFYGVAPAEREAKVSAMLDRLAALRDRIDPALALWPGCSVTAHQVASASAGRVQAVRPGAYPFGDLYLTRVTACMPAEAQAIHILATVVDKPEPGLALIDAGSKTFSPDRTPEGVHGLPADGRDFAVVRLNEEHGYVRGPATDSLEIGERILFAPAHVCPVINLTDTVVAMEGGRPLATWKVEGRGKTQ